MIFFIFKVPSPSSIIVEMKKKALT